VACLKAAAWEPSLILAKGSSAAYGSDTEQLERGARGEERMHWMDIAFLYIVWSTLGHPFPHVSLDNNIARLILSQRYDQGQARRGHSGVKMEWIGHVKVRDARAL
jgi:hypothetical protein